jgi:hypothetical protein
MKSSLSMFKITLIVLVIFFYSGCNEDYQTQQDAYKNEISKRKNVHSEHFKMVNKQIDDTFEHKTFYVPVYSHIYTSLDNYIKMSITLSVRNTDFSEDLYIENIGYYNTEGKLVKSYISQPHSLKSMGSTDFIVDLDDMSGGNGAKFLVKLASKSKSSIPIIQAVMIHSFGNNNFSFVTEGSIVK